MHGVTDVELLTWTCKMSVVLNGHIRGLLYWVILGLYWEYEMEAPIVY